MDQLLAAAAHDWNQESASAPTPLLETAQSEVSVSLPSYYSLSKHSSALPFPQQYTQTAESERNPHQLQHDDHQQQHRFRLSKDVSAALKATFEVNPRPTADQFIAMSVNLGVDEHKIKIWFQNMRSRNNLTRPINHTLLPPLSTYPAYGQEQPKLDQSTLNIPSWSALNLRRNSQPQSASSPMCSEPSSPRSNISPGNTTSFRRLSKAGSDLISPPSSIFGFIDPPPPVAPLPQTPPQTNAMSLRALLNSEDDEINNDISPQESHISPNTFPTPATVFSGSPQPQHHHHQQAPPQHHQMYPPQSIYHPKSIPSAPLHHLLSSTTTHPYHQSTSSKRFIMSREHLKWLKGVYAATPFPSPEQIDEIRKVTGMDRRRVRVWFQNRRAVEKREKANSAV